MPSRRWRWPPCGRRPCGSGTAIVPAFTRGPACMAQSVASLADAAPGRCRLRHRHVVQRDRRGVERHPLRAPVPAHHATWCGSSGRRWRGRRSPWRRRSFSVRSFKLGVRPEQPVPILIAALREGMLKLAGREGDGAIINWLSRRRREDGGAHRAGRWGRHRRRRSWRASSSRRPTTPTRCAAWAASPSPPTSTCRSTPPSTSGSVEARCSATCGASGRRATARPRSPPSRTRWSTTSSCGARRSKCREHIQRYVDNGVTTPALALLPFGIDTRQAIRDLAPR